MFIRRLNRTVFASGLTPTPLPEGTSVRAILEDPATGEIVLVEFDGQSLAGVGVWPWPRSVHARLVDTLMKALGLAAIAASACGWLASAAKAFECAAIAASAFG